MKNLIFALVSFVGLQQAGAMTAPEFSSAFVAQANHRLEITNQERTSQNKTPYCAKLNKQQIALVSKTAAKENITVGEFVTVVSENLKCYPEFWSPWERKNIGGVLFNTKAFVMDTWIVRDVLEDISEGRTLDDAQLLLEYTAPFGF